MRSRRYGIAVLAAASASALALGSNAAYAAPENTTAATPANTGAEASLTYYGTGTQSITTTVTGVTGGGAPTGDVYFSVFLAGTQVTAPTKIALTPKAGTNQSTAVYPFSNDRPASQSYEVRTTYSPATGSPYGGTPSGSYLTSGTYVTVVKRPTSTTANMSPEVAGRVVASVVAQGSGAANPSVGAVTFTVADAILGSTSSFPVTPSSGAASHQLTGGQYTISTAFADPGERYAASAASSPINIVLGSPTTASVTSINKNTSNGAKAGQVTIVGQLVSGSSALSAPATRKVTFTLVDSNGTTRSCTDPDGLSSGVAECVLLATETGGIRPGTEYSIIAEYKSVDVAYQSAKSPSTKRTVQ